MLCICAAEARVQMSAMRCAGLAELVLNAQGCGADECYVYCPAETATESGRASCNFATQDCSSSALFTNKALRHALGPGRLRFGTSLASCKTLAPEYGLSIDPYLGV